MPPKKSQKKKKPKKDKPKLGSLTPAVEGPPGENLSSQPVFSDELEELNYFLSKAEKYVRKSYTFLYHTSSVLYKSHMLCPNYTSVYP